MRNPARVAGTGPFQDCVAIRTTHLSDFTLEYGNRSAALRLYSYIQMKSESTENQPPFQIRKYRYKLHVMRPPSISLCEDPCMCRRVQVLAIPQDRKEYTTCPVPPFRFFLLCRYVIVPTRRSSAEAIHLMATHALGEAGSPYFIGLLADVSISQLLYIGTNVP